MIDHRPIAHLLPETGWTNDPIGPVKWRGRTHLFNQVNPAGPYWDRPHWGHFVSDDLVHWQRRPIALSPDPDGPDADGCYSGCVVVIDDVATMFYTGARDPGDGEIQATCIARSTDDDLDVWVKDAGNPVTTAPEGIEPRCFRDPFVWRDGGRWLQMVGAALPDAGGAVVLFSSEDLETWDYLGPMLTAVDVPGELWTGDMWECPALLRSPSGDALLVSVHDGERTPHNTVAIVGELTGERFRPSAVQRFDHGPDLYAPCLHTEPDGRTIVWGWSWEACSEQRQRDAGWAGVLTLPREVRVEGDRLLISPLPEVSKLRVDERDVAPTATDDGWLAAGAEGTALDLELTVGAHVPSVELRMLRSPDLEEYTTVGVDRISGRVTVDRDRSSTDDQALGGVHVAEVDLDDGPLELRVIVDRSIVEVFVADRATITTRVYPTSGGSTGVEVVGTAVGPDDVQLRVWGLGSVWGGDET